jgi:hypothetical protein
MRHASRFTSFWFMALNCRLIPSPLCGGRLGWGGITRLGLEASLNPRGRPRRKEKSRMSPFLLLPGLWAYNLAGEVTNAQS